MVDRLPSLNALRAFEAAARHLSLTEAARELHVTPAAVSHQIKALEADLGVTLLRRVKGAFELSATARAALPLLSGGLEQIARAAQRMRADPARRMLTISVGPTFAASWLVRRLGGFRAICPDIDVRMQTTDDIVDFARDDVDLAIRFGSGEYPGLESIRLFEEAIVPFCSPALLERGPPLERPADLAKHTLLHVDWGWSLTRGETLDWEMWLRAAGAPEVDAQRGPSFTHANLSLQAAIEGQGLALGSQSLAGDALADGRLICPFDVAVPVRFAYHLTYPLEAAGEARIVKFRDWILAEIAAGETG